MPAVPTPRALLAVGLAIVLVAVSAGPAVGRMRSFQTPSGNVGCLYSSSGGPGAFIRCDLFSENDVAYFLKRRGRGRRIHVTDTVGNPNAPVLRYGSARDFGPFRCRSRRVGLTCRTRANRHGFFISRGRQRAF